MCLATKGKEVYVKTQFDEVSLEINDNNEVEVKQVSIDSGLKEYFENITTSIIISETGKSHSFFGKKEDGNIEVGF